MRFYDPLTKEQLTSIQFYKYKSGVYSYLDNHVMNHFWLLAVNWLPVWMAPNLVTLIGLVFNVVASLLFALHCPTLECDAPPWVYIFGAVAMFVYQTMDALDGKQARRTGNSTPLGQLFDHGCDAFNSGLSVHVLCTTMSLGRHPIVFAIFHIVALPFFTGQWEEYHTGILRTGNALFGVTEGQLFVVAVHIFSAIEGDELWHTTVSLLGLATVRVISLLAFSICLMNLTLVVGNVVPVFTTECTFSEQERGNKRLGKINALLQLGPYAIFTLCGAAWLGAKGPGDTFSRAPLLFLAVHGVMYAFMVSRFIVAHMSKSAPPTEVPVLVPFALLAANAHMLWVDPFVAELCFLAGAAVAYVVYTVSVVDQLSAHLGIRVLSIPAKRAD